MKRISIYPNIENRNSLNRKMQKIFYLILFAVVLAAFSSCRKDDDTILPDPVIDFIQTKTITFEGLEGTTHNVLFNSPKPWVAEIHQTGSWLKGKPLYGDAGEANIEFSANSDNFGVFSREATIDIYIDGYQVYNIRAEQKSASTGDIKVEGKINEEGVMSLTSDAKGTKFSDTIYVTSVKQWTLDTDPASKDVLSFEINDMEQNGAEKKTQVIVTADYSKFAETSFSGKFYVKTSDGSAVAIIANAQSEVSVFDTHAHILGEQERTSYSLVDTIQHGVFQTTFYVDANVRWSIKNDNDWIETSADWGGASASNPSNIKSDGTINRNRQQVTLRVKTDKLSAEGKTCKMNITDERGMILKVIDIVFAGAGMNYVNYGIHLPANDVNGNPWAFEAHQSNVEAEGPLNRRRISMDFNIVTATNYTSIADAPFHLIMVDGANGKAHQREHHWAFLTMGDQAEQKRTDNGMYQKQLYIVANDRGDADDKNRLTNQRETRTAFIYIVPRDVEFDDMWKANGILKDEYADNLTMISQKNDPDTEYKFAFEGLEDGAAITVDPKGESKALTVVKGSYNKCDVEIEKLNDDNEWVKTSDCTMTYTWDENDNPLVLTFAFTRNESKYDPFRKEWTGGPRTFRIRVKAFIGDNEGSKVLYTIYANQEADHSS